MLQNRQDIPKGCAVFLSIYKSIKRQLSLAHEVILPSLSTAGVFWLLSGMLLSTTPSTLLSHVLRPEFIYVILAFFLARACGMTFNRVFDACIDSKNPRTAQRAIPSGRAKKYEIFAQGVLFLVSFLVITFYYLPAALGTMAIVTSFVVIVYSLTKRFTYLCHYFLGIVHACVPLVGSLYVTNSFQGVSTAVWLASAAAFCCVAAADILYSLQDEVFDRKLNLYSVPVQFGKTGAIKIARITSLCSVLFATTSLALFNPTISSSIFWLGAIGVFGYMWRSIRRNGYNLSSSLMPLMVPSLPFLFMLAVLIQWIQLSAT